MPSDANRDGPSKVAQDEPVTTPRPPGEAPRVGVGVFIVLIAISSLTPLAINIVVPSMPSIQRTFGISYGVAQLSLSLFLASMAVFLVVTGPLTDIFGRRPVLFAGLSIFIVATLAAGLAPDITVLLVARIAEAAGAGAGMVIGRAAVGDLYDRARAASMMGYVAMGYGLSPMVGPVIGGVIDEWLGWRASFMFLVGIGVIVAVASWRVLPETVRATTAGKTGPTFVGAIAELAKLPAFWAVAMTNALSSGAYFTLLGGGSFVSETLLGLTPAAYGAYFILVAAGYVGGNWFTGRYVSRFGPMPLVRVGGLIILVAVLAIATAAITGNLNAVTFFVPTLFIGFANGLTTPNCATIVIAMRPRLAGTAAGTTAGIHIGFGAVVATFLGVWIGFDPTARPLVIQMVSIALLTMVAIYLSERLLRRQE